MTAIDDDLRQAAIRLAAHASSVYYQRPLTEEDIQTEMRRHRV